MAAKARKQRSKISLFPKDQEVKSARRKLRRFNPHDLRSLISEAKTNDKADVDTAFFLAFRRRNDTQMKELLRRLGVDPSRPDAWERGFFQLAFLHHGVGHLAWYPRRTNRNSATWTPTHDLALLREVIILRQKGLSEHRAVKKLAADPKKRELFPYRRHGYRFSIAEDPQKREAALWARLQKLKASARGTSIVDLLVGVSQDGLSSIERSLYELEHVQFNARKSVKIDSHSKNAPFVIYQRAAPSLLRWRPCGRDGVEDVGATSQACLLDCRTR